MKKSSNKSGLRRITPLETKVMVAALIVGIIVFIFLDIIQTYNVKNIFLANLKENLKYEAVEARVQLHNHIEKFRHVTELIGSQKKLDEYLKSPQWSLQKYSPVRIYHQPPVWFPKKSLVRSLVFPDYTFLFDRTDTIREIFQIRTANPPDLLFSPEPIIIEKSIGQNLLINIDSTPFVISSVILTDQKNVKQGLLTVASILDNRFLTNALGGPHKHPAIMALLSSEKKPRIVISTNTLEIPTGTSLDDLKGKYLMIIEESFDYGSSEMTLKLASFISTASINEQTKQLMNAKRLENLITVISFLLAFTIIMFFVTRRINKITRKISGFSHNSLGVTLEEIGKGDQLEILDEQFQHLTGEIVKAKEIIKREAQEQTRVIVEKVSDALITINQDDIITTWNPAAKAIFGWSKDEVIGRGLSETILSSQRTAEHFNIFKTHIITDDDSKPENVIELEARNKAGHIFPVELSISKTKSNGSSLFIAIIRDITERKEMESMLEQSRLFWEESFNAISDVITIHDKDHNIERANRAAEKLLGMPMDEILSHKCYLSFHNATCPIENCPTSKTMVTGKPAEIEIYEPNLEKYLDIKVFPRFDENNRITGVTHVVKDITDRIRIREEKEKLEDHLRQTYKMEAIGTMAGGIAHDFNNILTIILCNADIVLEDMPDGSKVKDNIEQILKASKRAKDLIKQILTFSRQQKQVLVPCNPFKIITDSLKLLSFTIPTTVEIHKKLDAECGTINADPTQLQQVLMNLLTNSVHAMDEKGVLEISLKQVYLSAYDLQAKPNLSPGPYACLTISDTGIGMDLKIVERIFDPFFTTKKGSAGTGMGLSVVLGIVESHGGMITVDSKESEGTTFRIFLPIIENHIGLEPEEPAPLPTGNEKILFVDDVEAVTKMAGQMLERLGYKVTTCIDSHTALKTFKLDPDKFDLIITDQTMPNMSGAELAIEMLKIKPKIPIIICTGYSKKIDAESAKKIGIKEFLFKPLEKRKLAETIRKVLDEDEKH